MKVVGDLPERSIGVRGLDWPAIVEYVRKQKGLWVEIDTFDPSVASHIRSGRYPSIDPSEFEVTTQKAEPVNGKRRSTLFMRLMVD